MLHTQFLNISCTKQNQQNLFYQKPKRKYQKLPSLNSVCDQLKQKQIKLKINNSYEFECEKKACYSVNQSLKNKIIQKEYQAKQKTIIEKIINQPHSIQREKNSIGEELQHINKSNQIVKKT
jgi:hypothetical protein